MIYHVLRIKRRFAPLTSPIIKSAMAKFIIYKLFIVLKRGFDKNDRKIIILPKTVKKLNNLIEEEITSWAKSLQP